MYFIFFYSLFYKGIYVWWKGVGDYLWVYYQDGEEVGGDCQVVIRSNRYKVRWMDMNNQCTVGKVRNRIGIKIMLFVENKMYEYKIIMYIVYKDM